MAVKMTSWYTLCVAILLCPLLVFAAPDTPNDVNAVTDYVSHDNNGVGNIDNYISIYNGGQLIWEDAGGVQGNVTLNGDPNTSMGIGNDGEAYIYNSGGTANFIMKGDPAGGSWQHVIKMDTSGRLIVGSKDNLGGASEFTLEDGNIFAPGLIQVNKMGTLNLKTTVTASKYPGTIYIFDNGRLENSGQITLEGANNTSAEYRAALSLGSKASYQGWTNDLRDGYGNITLGAYSDLINFAQGNQTSDLWRNITVANGAGETARILNYNNGESAFYGNGSWTVGDTSSFERYTLDARAGYVNVDVRSQAVYVYKGAMWDQKGEGDRINFNLGGSKLIIDEGGWFRTEGTFNNAGAVVLRPNSRFSFGHGAIYNRGATVDDQNYYYDWNINAVAGYSNGDGEFYIDGDKSTIIDIGSTDASMWRTFLRHDFTNYGSIYLRANMDPAENMFLRNYGLFAVTDGATLTVDRSAGAGEFVFEGEGVLSIGNANPLTPYDQSASGKVVVQNDAVLAAAYLQMGTGGNGGLAELSLDAGHFKGNQVLLSDNSQLSLTNSSNFDYATLYVGATSASYAIVSVQSGSRMNGSDAVFDKSTLNIDGASSYFGVSNLSLINGAIAQTTDSGELNATYLYMDSSTLTNTSGLVNGYNLSLSNGANFTSGGALVFGGSTPAVTASDSYFTGDGAVFGALSELKASKITITAGSTLTIDPGGNFATTTKLTSANGIDVSGTLRGSAMVGLGTGDLYIKSGGVIRLAAEDGMTLDKDIYFQNGSTYHASINTRSAGAVDDIQSLIKARESFFDTGAIISVGANERPELVSRKYAILVTDRDYNGQSLDINNNLIFRDSLLTGYSAEWIREASGAYVNKDVLYIEVLPTVVTPTTLASSSSFTVNEQKMAGVFEALNQRSGLSPELDGLLDYLYTQVADINEFERLTRDVALTSYANYLSYTPQVSRLLGNGTENRLARLREDRKSASSSLAGNLYGANSLWVMPTTSFNKLSGKSFQKALDGQLSALSAHINGGQRDAIYSTTMTPTASYARQSGRNEQGFDAQTYGLSAGIDRSYKNVTYGLSFGYGHTTLDAEHTDQTIKSHAMQIGLYGETHLGNWFASSKLAYTYLWNRSETMYNATLPIYQDARARFHTNAYSADVHTGYDLNFDDFMLTPSIGLDLVHVRQAGFTENSAGGLNRAVDSATHTSVEVQAKLEFGYNHKPKNGNAYIARIYGEYGRELNDSATRLSGQFINTGDSFDAFSVDAGKNRMGVGGALDVLLNKATILSMQYNFDAKSGYTSNSVGLTLEHRF